MPQSPIQDSGGGDDQDARDVALLERVELRLAHNSDDQLPSFMERYLPAVIARAGRDDGGTAAGKSARAVALRILSHLTRRLPSPPAPPGIPVLPTARGFAPRNLPRGERSLSLVFFRKAVRHIVDLRLQRGQARARQKGATGADRSEGEAAVIEAVRHVLSKAGEPDDDVFEAAVFQLALDFSEETLASVPKPTPKEHALSLRAGDAVPDSAASAARDALHAAARRAEQASEIAPLDLDPSRSAGPRAGLATQQGLGEGERDGGGDGGGNDGVGEGGAVMGTRGAATASLDDGSVVDGSAAPLARAPVPTARGSLPLCASRPDAARFVRFLTNVLLLPYSPLPAPDPATGTYSACAGVPAAAVARVLSGASPEVTGPRLRAWKIAAIDYLTSGALPDDDMSAVPLLIASCDGSEAVATKATIPLRALGPGVAESDLCISECFRLIALEPPIQPGLRRRLVQFLSGSLKGANSPSAVRVGLQCVAAEVEAVEASAARAEQAAAAAAASSVSAMLNNGAGGGMGAGGVGRTAAGTAARQPVQAGPAARMLCDSGMAFLRWVVAHMDDGGGEKSGAAAPSAGQVLLTGGLTLLTRARRAPGGATVRVRSFLYSLLGTLARRHPGPYMNASAALPTMLWDALRIEQEPDVLSSIHEALSAIRSVFEDALGPTTAGRGVRASAAAVAAAHGPAARAAVSALRARLVAVVVAPGTSASGTAPRGSRGERIARLAAVQWCGALYRSDDAPTRYALLYGLGDERTDIREEAARYMDDQIAEAARAAAAGAASGATAGAGTQRTSSASSAASGLGQGTMVDGDRDTDGGDDGGGASEQARWCDPVTFLDYALRGIAARWPALAAGFGTDVGGGAPMRPAGAEDDDDASMARSPELGRFFTPFLAYTRRCLEVHRAEPDGSGSGNAGAGQDAARGAQLVRYRALVDALLSTSPGVHGALHVSASDALIHLVSNGDGVPRGVVARVVRFLSASGADPRTRDNFARLLGWAVRRGAAPVQDASTSLVEALSSAEGSRSPSAVSARAAVLRAAGYVLAHAAVLLRTHGGGGSPCPSQLDPGLTVAATAPLVQMLERYLADPGGPSDPVAGATLSASERLELAAVASESAAIACVTCPRQEPPSSPPAEDVVVEVVMVVRPGQFAAAAAALLDVLRRAEDRALLERAAAALGLLLATPGGGASRSAPAGDEDGPADYRVRCVDALVALKDTKGEEVQFAVGEALASAGAAPLSRVVTAQLAPALGVGWARSDPAGFATAATTRTGHPAEDTAARDALMRPLLARILKLLEGGQSLLARSAIASWLLAVTHLGGTLPAIRGSLNELQDVFLTLLMDSPEATQRSASRGLGVCYDLGDAKLRDKLVAELTLAINGKGRSAGKVVNMTSGDDGELQVEITIPAPSVDGSGVKGRRVGTYRELVSAAQEMGQPELIYRFLDMAGAQSSWASRRGAAFGFSGIAAKAGLAGARRGERGAGSGSDADDAAEQDSAIVGLIPKLYRYQYDSNPTTREAMSQIWRELVADPSRAVTRHLPAIAAEAIASTTSRLWRVREASCLALADLISGRGAEEVDSFFENAWRAVLRALDDIKETVRAAAERAVEAMGSLTVRLCDAADSRPSVTAKFATLAVPLLIREGIESRVEARIALGVRLVARICQVAGPGIAAVVPETAGALLENMSSLEPQKLNYMSFHTDKIGITREELDKARLAASRGTLVAEALDLCVRHLRSGDIGALVRRMDALIRGGVGLPTKGAVARLVVHLALNHPDEMRAAACAPRLLRSLGRHWLDRAAPIRAAYADAAASLSKLVPREDLDAFVDAALGKAVGLAVGRRRRCRRRSSDAASDAPGERERGADGAAQPATNLAHLASDEARAVSGEFFLRLGRCAGDTFTVYESDVLPVAFVAARDPCAPVAEVWTQVYDENCASTAGTLRHHRAEVVSIVTRLLASSSWLGRVQACRAVTAAVRAIPDELAKSGDASKLLSESIAMLRARRSLWTGKEDLVRAAGSLAAAVSRGSGAVSGAVDFDGEMAALLAAEAGRRDGGTELDGYIGAAIDALCVMRESAPPGTALRIRAAASPPNRDNDPATAPFTFAGALWPALRHQLTTTTVKHDSREEDDDERTGLGVSRVVKRTLDRARRQAAARCAGLYHDFDLLAARGAGASNAESLPDPIPDVFEQLAQCAVADDVHVRSACLNALKSMIATASAAAPPVADEPGAAPERARAALASSASAAVTSLADKKFLKVRTPAVGILESIAGAHFSVLKDHSDRIERAALDEEDIAIRERLKDLAGRLKRG